MTQPFIKIIIAEDNDVSRNMMAQVLEAQGYAIVHARDGDEAIQKIQQEDMDVAIVDINMSPKGGFEFVKYLVTRGIDLPVVIVTGDDSSDLLIEASNLGVQRLLQKPIQPKRLSDTVGHILKKRGINPQPMGVETHKSVFTDQQLMQRAIALAEQNFKSGKGGPFGAVIANEQGKVLGEGVNGITSRCDPTAHAEVMAIRQAAEKLGQADLSSCKLYISSEPTMMGKALIISVGIEKVYYGLSHEEMKSIRASEDKVRAELQNHEMAQTRYTLLCHEEAMDMFQSCLKAHTHKGEL